MQVKFNEERKIERSVKKCIFNLEEECKFIGESLLIKYEKNNDNTHIEEMLHAFKQSRKINKGSLGNHFL